MKVLIVEEEGALRSVLTERLSSEGVRTDVVTDAREALKGLQTRDVCGVVVVDKNVPNDRALNVLRELKQGVSETYVILVQDSQRLQRAMIAMKAAILSGERTASAVGSLTSTVPPASAVGSLTSTVPPASAPRSISEPRTAFGLPVIVGRSNAMADLRALVSRVAESPVSTVLITGESGTGKDLVARAIHAESPRRARAFVNVTCSALPESLLEAELFGYEADASHNGDRQRPGLLELADGGTLFLDEISEMTPALQAKLLRFIDERTFRRLGGTTDVHVDVRVLAATHHDVDELVASGRFRQDLYYRLRGVIIHLPPLRGRKEDVEPLAMHFLGELSATFGKRVTHISPEALERLRGHGWPGNVRELKHCIERGLLLVDGDVLTRVDCGSAQSGSGEYLLRLPREGLVLAELERSLVQQALEATRWNQVRAARLLGLNRDQVRYRIEKFGLSAPPNVDDGRAA